MTKQKNYNILGLIFLIISFYTIYRIRNDFDGNYFYILFITIVCISTDIGGYVFGKIFKGPKLTKISPNKNYIRYGWGVFVIFNIYLSFFN